MSAKKFRPEVAASTDKCRCGRVAVVAAGDFHFQHWAAARRPGSPRLTGPQCPMWPDSQNVELRLRVRCVEHEHGIDTIAN
eukprot:scaffold77256_cov35-Tisochrysis_lutea.AAC.1